MSEIRVLARSEDWKPIAKVMESLGSQMPAPGTALVFAEFEGDELLSFQILHLHAIFMEGLWAKDGRAHLLSVWKRVEEFLKEYITPGGGTDVFTMVRGDEQGERIVKVGKRLGMEALDWKILRRKF